MNTQTPAPVVFVPSASDCDTIRTICRAAARRWAGRGDTTLEAGIRYHVDSGRMAPDCNALHVSDVDTHADSDLGDFATWADFRAGFAMVRGFAVVDFYVRVGRPCETELACNVVALFDAAGLVALFDSGVGFNTLWARPGADVAQTIRAAYPAAPAPLAPAPVDALARVAECAAELTQDRGRVFASDDTFRTLYTPDGAPAVTLTRARLIGGHSLHYAHDVDGRPLAVFTGNPTWAQLSRALLAFVRAGADLDTMTARELAHVVDDCEAREADNRAQADAASFATFRASALSRALRAQRRGELARAALAGFAEAPAAPLHFCPHCEGQTAAPGLCRDCEDVAEFGPHGVEARREELAQRHRATGFRTLGQGGVFPLWAIAAERAASAIDDALELGLDLADPFAPGWTVDDDAAPLWG